MNYYIADYFSESDAYQQVSEASTLEEIWISKIPNSCIDTPIPKLFKTRADAMAYKDKAQSAANVDWKKNSHIHTLYGHSKPKYKIYKYEIIGTT